MPKKEDRLETAIQNVLISMEEYGPDSPEYPRLVEQLEKLTNLRAKRKWWRVDSNTALMVAGNLLGIAIIVIVEQNHVWRSKGTDFIMKVK